MNSTNLKCALSAILVFTGMAAFAENALAQDKGMVIAEGGFINIFRINPDNSTTVVATRRILNNPFASGDCVITPNGTKGFVTDFLNRVWVVDLTTNTLNPTPIGIGNPGEDIALTENGNFAVVCDGSTVTPVVSFDTTNGAIKSTVSSGPGVDCNSVSICNNGPVNATVLTTSARTRTVREWSINLTTGILTDTGRIKSIGAEPNNVRCAPGGATGIVITTNADQISSFSIPLTSAPFISTRNLAGSYGLVVLTNIAGNAVFTRDAFNFIQRFTYNSATGVIANFPTFTRSVGFVDGFYGMEQMALSPDQTTLYVPQPNALRRYRAADGAFLGSMFLNQNTPSGVCVPSGGAITTGPITPGTDPPVDPGTNPPVDPEDEDCDPSTSTCPDDDPGDDDDDDDGN